MSNIARIAFFDDIRLQLYTHKTEMIECIPYQLYH